MNTRPWKIDAYRILFDEQGATIVHRFTADRYRVNAVTATNRLSFSHYHIKLCCAMVGNHPEDLEPYRVPTIDGDSLGAFFSRLAELIAMAAEEIEVDLEDVHEVEIEYALDIWHVTLCGERVCLWDYDHHGQLEAHHIHDEETLDGLLERVQAAL